MPEPRLAAAELRSVILRARRLAHDDAKTACSRAAVRARLPAKIEKKRAASTTHVEKAAPGEAVTTERLDTLRLRGSYPHRGRLPAAVN